MRRWYFECETKEPGDALLKQRFILEGVFPLVWMTLPETRQKYEMVVPGFIYEITDLDAKDIAIMCESFKERPTLQDFLSRPPEPPKPTFWIYCNETGSPVAVGQTIEELCGRSNIPQDIDNLPEGAEIVQAMVI